MASEYDFQRIERNVTSLQKKWDSFQEKAKNVTSSAKSLSFDERNYGKAAVEKRVNAILNDGKKQLNNIYNSSINEVQRHAYASKEKIKFEARTVNYFVSSLERALQTIEEINRLYAKQQYEAVLSAIQAMPSIELNNADMVEYLGLLKFNSMDALCSSYLSDFNGNKAKFFAEYVNECKRLHAKKHLPLALSKALCYYAKLVEINLSSNKKAAYNYAKTGLSFYEEMEATNKQVYNEIRSYLYDSFVSLFNDISQQAYDSFEYPSVVEFLQDSRILEKKDIGNPFFQAQDTSKYVRFQYVTEKYLVANEVNLNLAIDDTIELVTTAYQREYYTFWIERIATTSWRMLHSVLRKQENLLSTQKVLQSAVIISEIVCSCHLNAELAGNVAIEICTYYYNYIMRVKKGVPLLAFLSCVTSLWDTCNVYQGRLNKEETETNLNAVMDKLASISYATIRKYSKHCAGTQGELLTKTNELYVSAAAKIGAKKPKKDLMGLTHTKPITDEITVTIVTYEEQRGKNKAFLIGGGIAAAIAIMIILIILLT